jgi:hypothetical protein
MLGKNVNRKKISLVFGAGVIIFFVLFGITSPDTEDANDKKTAFNSPAIASTSTQTPIPQFIFDIPSLIGKNIDEVRGVLGSSVDAERDMEEPNADQLSLGTKQWDNTFSKDNQELMVTFDVKSRKVIEFFLAGDSKEKLLEVGNLEDGNSNYSIESVKALKDSSKITGIVITSK